MSRSNSRIRIGIGGWTFEPWRDTFYPKGLSQKRELEYASGKMSSIEVNGTYYSAMKPDTYRKWHDETPEDFVFTLKGPRYATNRKVLAGAGESVEKFLTGGVLELKDKLGPLNWQFMGTKKFDLVDFEAFLDLLPKSLEGRTLRHAVEVRHESFKTPDFYEMARKHDVAIIHGADSKYPEIEEATAAYAYVRIMGTREDEPKGYSEAELDAWAKRAKAWAADGRDVYLYVISGAKQHNPAAAMALLERI